MVLTGKTLHIAIRVGLSEHFPQALLNDIDYLVPKMPIALV